jgi:hypothetical protein
MTVGWGYTLMVEHLPSTHRALGSIHSAAKKKFKNMVDFVMKCD